MSAAPTYYKFLSADQIGRHSQKRLPIGEWIRVKGPLVLCSNGIHATTIEHAIEWLDERCHLIEWRGEHIVGDNKTCFRDVLIHPALPTWNDRSARLFAADCAEHVLRFFEREYPTDDRPRKAIEAARAFARGEISAAARAASWTASWTAAWAAARDAAWAAARDAAWAAARAAAWDAARDAARDAAWAAAWAAARDAARDAAWAAAWAAAGDAERRWQTDLLRRVFAGEACQ